MFNGIIFNTGKIQSIDRNQKSILIGVKTNLHLKSKNNFKLFSKLLKVFLGKQLHLYLIL